MVTIVSDANIKKSLWLHVLWLTWLHCDISVIRAPQDLCQHKDAQNIQKQDVKVLFKAPDLLPGTSYDGQILMSPWDSVLCLKGI